MSELLSVPAVGRIYGTCAPGARRWTVEFVAAPTTSERFTYRISGSPRLTFKLSPGQVVTLQLVPGAAKRHEPADPVSGYGPSTVPIATPVKLTVEQGSEPRVYRVDVNLGVAAAIGDTSDCALISSTVRASTYYPGGPPPA
jgi:hypothetical protein